MQISFNLPQVFFPGSTHAENALVLQSLLECLISIDMTYLRLHKGTPKLYETAVVYDRTEEWDSIPALYARGFGDCKSLSAALIAEYRLTGKDALPVFRFIEDELTGQLLYHILVQVGDQFEDPSRALGMNRDENDYFFLSTG